MGSRPLPRGQFFVCCDFNGCAAERNGLLRNIFTVRTVASVRRRPAAADWRRRVALARAIYECSSIVRWSCPGRQVRAVRRGWRGAAPVISTGTHRMHAPGRPCSLVHHRPVNYDGDQTTSRATPPIFWSVRYGIDHPTTQARGAVADASSITCCTGGRLILWSGLVCAGVTTGPRLASGLRANNSLWELLCPRPGALSDDFVWRLSLFYCLSVTYIGPKSITERSRKTKIGRGSPRHTRLGHHFQGQNVKGQGHQAALLTAVLARRAAAAVTARTYWA